MVTDNQTGFFVSQTVWPCFKKGCFDALARVNQHKNPLPNFMFYVMI